MSAHHEVDITADPLTDRTVDPLTAGGIALTVVALACWIAAIITHTLNRNAPNDAPVILIVGAAAVATVCSVVCFCAASLRHHHRRACLAICRKIEAVHAARPRPGPGQLQAAGPDVEWRAYLAGRIDRDE